jgi:voltage-gated potassium channel
MEPIKKAKSAGKEIRAANPLKRLFLLDLISDKDSRLVFYWTAGLLVVGTLIYHWLEGWSYLDALYFCVISLATIGYGDLTPTTPEAKIFTIIYVINGIALLLMLFDRIRAVRGQRLETQVETESSQDQ